MSVAFVILKVCIVLTAERELIATMYQLRTWRCTIIAIIAIRYRNYCFLVILLSIFVHTHAHVGVCSHTLPHMCVLVPTPSCSRIHPHTPAHAYTHTLLLTRTPTHSCSGVHPHTPTHAHISTRADARILTGE